MRTRTEPGDERVGIGIFEESDSTDVARPALVCVHALMTFGEASLEDMAQIRAKGLD